MTATELAHLSMPELKSICIDRAISVGGDRRLKASYLHAIVTFDCRQAEEVALPSIIVIADPLDEPVELPISAPIERNECCVVEPSHPSPLEIELTPDSSHQLPAPQPHRNASIVLIVPLILALALFLTVKTIIASLSWSFAHFAPFDARRWGSSIEAQNSNDSINYFPSLA